MSCYYQIYTGSFSGRGIHEKEIMGKLPPTSDTKGIIVGWSKDIHLYKRLRDYTRSHGISLWLWFPVLSEHSAQEGFTPQIDIEGNPFGSAVFDTDENFDFSCPSDETLADRLMELYDRVYGEIGFDGVFLDRIRYPSMTMGINALFGCQCSSCKRWYEEQGLEPEKIQILYKKIGKNIQNPDGNNSIGLLHYEKGRYLYSDSTLECLCRLKQRRINQTIREVAERFRSRGLLIGMDLFAPFLAPLVGQDYEELGKMADFIKPMLYRLTNTPAGFEFELDAMAKAIGVGEERQKEALKMLREFYGIKDGNLQFFVRELEAVAEFADTLGKKGLFVPGVEIHTIQNRPQIAIQDIRENIRMLEAMGFYDRVACWDILSAEGEALNAFINTTRGEGD